MNRFADFLAVFVATGLGSGFSPKAPGTLGSFIGLVLAVPFLSWAPQYLWLLFGLVLLIGWWATRHYCIRTQLRDPGRVVIDEILGIWIPLFIFRKTDLEFLVVIFCAFRIFDVLKPPPIRQIDQLGKKFKIGWAQSFLVTADDLLAGVFTAAVWQGIITFQP